MTSAAADEPLGYSAQVRKSLTEGFRLMGVQREVFIGWTFLALLGIVAGMKHAPWSWYWSVVIGVVVWAGALYGLLALERWDPQWLEVLSHRLWESDVDDV